MVFVGSFVPSVFCDLFEIYLWVLIASSVRSFHFVCGVMCYLCFMVFFLFVSCYFLYVLRVLGIGWEGGI